ncbi:hypothetical protein L209DRAFT_755691 [Thermothelomyces heterothallicus CBS 203.75]
MQEAACRGKNPRLDRHELNREVNLFSACSLAYVWRRDCNPGLPCLISMDSVFGTLSLFLKLAPTTAEPLITQSSSREASVRVLLPSRSSRQHLPEFLSTHCSVILSDRSRFSRIRSYFRGGRHGWQPLVAFTQLLGCNLKGFLPCLAQYSG